jgi:hypothetical protein
MIGDRGIDGRTMINDKRVPAIMPARGGSRRFLERT